MGKNIGGTLGAPMEWKRQINDVCFYTQDYGGEPLPNDDLDLQLLWLIALEKQGVDINSSILGEYWHSFITPHWAEYGNGRRNMRSGIMPPLSGMLNNPYKDSCGAFIRSEIWACITPGHPEIAAKYAYEDASVDHGNGEGTYAEIFCAVIESAAFAESDTYKLIEIGLSYIPEDCGVAKAVRCVVDSYKSGKTWLESRHELLEKYRGHYYSGPSFGISDEERAKGFEDGPPGWDAPSNIGIIIVGWLYGKGDFGNSLCIAVNCGEDTDCTAATLGSILGIINGIDAIPEKWITPIGRNIKTCCLNSADLYGIFEPIASNIDSLAERVEKIMKQAALRFFPNMKLTENEPTDLSSMTLNKHDMIPAPGPRYSFPFYDDIYVDYENSPYIKSGETKRVKVSMNIGEGANLKLYADAEWAITPSRMGKLPANMSRAEIPFEFYIENVPNSVNRFVLEITVDGRHSVMLVPILLMNGNFFDEN